MCVYMHIYIYIPLLHVSIQQPSGIKLQKLKKNISTLAVGIIN